MKLLSIPSGQPSSLKKHPFYWKSYAAEKQVFHLYRENHRVATLCMPPKKHKPGVMKLLHGTFEFHDNSSFFAACLLLIEKESGKCIGRIDKNPFKTGEGTINLQGEEYGWKFNKRPDVYFLLMDQERKRVFSYHYGKDYVRLLINKPGMHNLQIVPLLCIGLYLLPLWQK